MKLEAGKVAVVTGAASGIGFALADRFATAGMHVVLADVDEAGLAAAAEKIGARGVDTLTVRTDVSDEGVGAGARGGRGGALRDRARRVQQRGRHVERRRVVRAALGVDVGDGRELLGRDPRRARVPARSSSAQGEGHIVNTASIAGLLPGFGAVVRRDASTRSSRSPTISITTMRQAGLPIGVSVLCPGWVRTNILDADRNWPAELGEEPPAALGADVVLGHVRRVIDEGMPPAVVADLVADAVEAERFWVLPHPEFVEVAVQRWHDIAEGVNPRIDVEMPGLPSAAQIAEEVRAALFPPTA